MEVRTPETPGKCRKNVRGARFDTRQDKKLLLADSNWRHGEVK